MKNPAYLKNVNPFLFTIIIALCAANMSVASAKLPLEPQHQRIVTQAAYKVQTSHPVTPYDYQPNNYVEKAKKCYWLTPFQPSAGCQYQQQQNHYNMLLGKWRKSPPLSLQQKQFGVKVHL